MVGAVKPSVALPAPGSTVFNVGELGALIPVPVNVISFRLPLALDAMTTLPVRSPATVGANVIFRLHDPPAPSPEPQLFVAANSPDTEMLLKVIIAPPILVSVTA